MAQVALVHLGGHEIGNFVSIWSRLRVATLGTAVASWFLTIATVDSNRINHSFQLPALVLTVPTEFGLVTAL